MERRNSIGILQPLVGAEDEVRGMADAAIAERLISDPPVAELAHGMLAAFVAVLLWQDVPGLAAVAWCATVWIAAAWRANARRALQAGAPSAATIRRVVRRDVTIVALAWGLGAVAAIPRVPLVDTAVLLVVLSGLASAAVMTLVADRRAFLLFIGCVMAPLAAGVAIASPIDSSRKAVLLVVVTTFTWFLTQFHARLNRNAMAYERAKVQLAGSEARTRSILDTAADGIVTVDDAGTILSFNPAAREMFRWDANAILGRSAASIIPATSQATTSLAAQLDGSSGKDEETRQFDARRADGSTFPVQISVGDAAVAGVRLRTLVIRDFTERQRADRAVREAERRYRELVESASDLVWEVDSEGRWSYLNVAASSVYGRPPESMLGHAVVEYVHPDFQAKATVSWNRVLAGEEILDWETVHVSADGTPRSLSFSARPVLDLSGHVVGAHGIARDVTARAQAAQALRDARDPAERAAEARAAFLANMSHEIRTPMNAVLGMTELLLETELASDQRRSLEIIRSSGEGLLTLLNDILDLSKIEADHLDIEAIPFDLGGLIDSVASLFAVDARARGLELVVDPDPDLPPVLRGDPTRIRQVLSNLLGNAVKFTHAGEIVINARTMELRDGVATIRVSVRDTGIGIDPTQIARILEPFSQADASMTRRYGGTGLGLSIARGLIHRMGGDLSVRSEVDTGSDFSFVLSLPVAEGEALAQVSSTVSELKGKRALVIDDNATNRRILRGLLQSVGMRVDEAPSAALGFSMLQAGRESGSAHAIAVLDAQMPEEDGFALAARIRQDPIIASTPILMLSSRGQRGDGQRCRELGIDGYLTKPTGRADLIQAVATVTAGPGAAQAVAGGVVTRHAMAEARRKLRLLLAEDNPVNQEVALAMLRRRGHVVDVVGNGRDAVAAVKTGRYDLVLMDIQMPEMDGMTATAAIRQLPGGAQLPIIACTAHALSGERERCIEAGMDDYVAKPFKAHELFAIVESWGERRAPAAQEADESAPPVDLVAFRRSLRAAGAEDAADVILGIFVRDGPGRATAVSEAVESGDAKAIARAAHAFRSGAGTIGARELTSLLAQLEAVGDSGNLAEAEALAGRIATESDRVLGYVRAELAAATAAAPVRET